MTAMRPLPSCCLLFVLAAPAFAQEASPGIDWSKPVIVDPNRPAPRAVDEPKPVEVYTITDLKALGSPALDGFVRSLEQNQPGAAPEKSSPAEKDSVSPDDPLANY